MVGCQHIKTTQIGYDFNACMHNVTFHCREPKLILVYKPVPEKICQFTIMNIWSCSAPVHTLDVWGAGLHGYTI